MPHDFDLIVIGAGPGGVAAAKVVALQGRRVALVTNDDLLGYGLSGAYKSKAMYEVAREYATFVRRWKVCPLGGNLSLAAMTQGHAEEAEHLRALYIRQFQAIGITLLSGYGSFVDEHTVVVGDQTYTAENIVISTGTRPRLLPDLPEDRRRVLTSDEAVQVDRNIRSLLVLGAGVIGCEFASIFAALGVEVTLVDSRPRILPQEDADVSAFVAAGFAQLGIEVRSEARARSITLEGEHVVTDLGDGRPVVSDAVLLAIGRVPNTERLGLERAGVQLDRWGAIPVNEHLQTSAPHIYAVGDVGQRDTQLDLALVHVAEAEGRHAAVHLLGHQSSYLALHHVPFIIFSLPMVAGAGESENQARARLGDGVRVGKYANCRNHRAHARRSRSGFVKLIVGPPGDDRVYGVRGVGDGVDTIIGEVSTMIEHGLPYTRLLDAVHAHPSMSESLQGAARIIAGYAPPYVDGEEFAYSLELDL